MHLCRKYLQLSWSPCLPFSVTAERVAISRCTLFAQVPGFEWNVSCPETSVALLTSERAQCQNRCLHWECWSRFILSHLCIYLLNSPDIALWTLCVQLTAELELSPMKMRFNLHCPVWTSSHFIHVLKFQLSDDGRLWQCIFRSGAFLLGVLKEIKKASVYCPYTSERTNAVQEISWWAKWNRILSHFRYVHSYLHSGIPSVIYLPLAAKSFFSDSSSFFTTL